MTKKIETVEDDAGKATTYHRHPNGGGLLGPGVQAAEDAFIAASTYVEAGARIGSGCRIGRGSWIDCQAVVGDHVFIGDDVYVGRGTVLGARAHVGSHSRIGAGTLIGFGTRLHGDSIVPDGAHLADARPARIAAVRPRKTHGPDARIAA
ncbi:DapH/DapD/GlmU-related protein [Arthrobacter oryzae]|uniref:Transferase n=1 Tax=Arthrobacter oryzae TaxID=409290 RepID=A0A3N0BS66_9MICC|nr:DapH/DapD/GlmU-related protein [Arthrobacter oryzae]RNL51923.1 transferase [Arthrobacter oryzae]